MSDRDQAMLFEWTRSVIDAVVYSGHITPPWRPTEHVYSLLHGYFGMGMTPTEGAEAMFAPRH
jgi:hypothetical protein